MTSKLYTHPRNRQQRRAIAQAKAYKRARTAQKYNHGFGINHADKPAGYWRKTFPLYGGKGGGRYLNSDELINAQAARQGAI
jgi:hypothetical protein